MDQARDIIRAYDTLRADRSNLEPQWQDIAELMRPMRADFTVSRVEGQLRGLQIFDGAAMIAGDNLAAALWGSITNAASDWFGLTHPDEDVSRDEEVAAWMGDATDRIRRAFSANGMTFYSRVLDFYSDLVMFGTGIFYVDEPAPGRLRFTNRALAECVIAQDDEERVDTVIRRFQLTAKQACDKWGDKAPERCKKALDTKPYDKSWFIHAVMPNRGRAYGRAGAAGMPWRSVHLCQDTREICQEGGFEEFPYQVARWGTLARGLYGESPAMLALADTKVLQAMVKTNLVASQRAADPPTMAPDEVALRGLRVTPGQIIYGGMDINGRPLLAPLESRGAFTLTEAMAEQKREAIRQAFFANLIVLSGRGNQTATEVLARQEEQLRLMGPQLGRVQAEFLDPLVRRVFMIMWRAGAFGMLPQAMADQAVIQVEYVSPLARAQKAANAQTVLRTLEAILPMAQARPEVLDVFNFDELARELADAYGLPPRGLRDPRQVAEIRQARAEAQNQQAAEASELAAAGPMRDAAQGALALAQAQRLNRDLAA